GPNAAAHAIGYAMHRSRSHHAVIRVYDAAGNVIETHEHAGDFERVVKFFIAPGVCSLVTFVAGPRGTKKADDISRRAIKIIWKPFEIAATATEQFKNASALPD